MDNFNPTDLWNRCLLEAESRLESTEFEAWLKNSAYEDINGTRLVIRFRNSFVAGHAKSRFGNMLEEIIQTISGRNELALQFIGDPAEPGPSSTEKLTPTRETSSSDYSFLRSNYTFEHFSMEKFKQHTKDIISIYNEAWVNHKGVPKITQEKGEAIINQLKPILEERIIWLGYYKKERILIGWSRK